MKIPTHFVSKPALERRRESKVHLLLAACGAVEPQSVSSNPRFISCQPCLRNMTSEERTP